MGDEYIEFIILLFVLYRFEMSIIKFLKESSKQKGRKLKLISSYNTQGCEISQWPKLH